jgi:hypothetical protein
VDQRLHYFVTKIRHATGDPIGRGASGCRLFQCARGGGRCARGAWHRGRLGAARGEVRGPRISLCQVATWASRRPGPRATARGTRAPIGSVMRVWTRFRARDGQKSSSQHALDHRFLQIFELGYIFSKYGSCSVKCPLQLLRRAIRV